LLKKIQNFGVLIWESASNVCLFVSFFFCSWNNNYHKISPNFTRSFQYDDDEHIFSIFLYIDLKISVN
jgi:hypothetical protein